MTLAAAALWVFGITLVFLALGTAAISLRESAGRDVFAQFICQVAAYSLGLFALLRFYGPDTPIRQFIGLRPSHVGIYPVALLLGVATALPANVLYELAHQLFPQLDGTPDVSALYFEASSHERALIAVAVVAAGPVIEEVLFRGALFGPLLRSHRRPTVIVGTAVYFALVHLDLHKMAPILLVGLLLGYVRAASGSLYPAMLMHVGFNAVPLGTMMLGHRPPQPGGAFDPPLVPTVLSTVAVVVLVVAVRYLARRDPARVARSREG
jgi:membrane protease YdiL (CAAX protease family)